MAQKESEERKIEEESLLECEVILNELYHRVCSHKVGRWDEAKQQRILRAKNGVAKILN